MRHKDYYKDGNISKHDLFFGSDGDNNNRSANFSPKQLLDYVKANVNGFEQDNKFIVIEGAYTVLPGSVASVVNDTEIDEILDHQIPIFKISESTSFGAIDDISIVNEAVDYAYYFLLNRGKGTIGLNSGVTLVDSDFFLVRRGVEGSDIVHPDYSIEIDSLTGVISLLKDSELVGSIQISVNDVNGLTDALNGLEPGFDKNTAFNKNFGDTAGTVVEGDDPRLEKGEEAHSWGDHSQEGYLTQVNEQDPTVPQHVKDITSFDIISWDTAFGWGDHSQEGYLTSFVETDPIFTASPSFGITQPQVFNWDTAYNWGDHSLMGYLTSVAEESDPIFTASPAFEITQSNIINWEASYNWGDHSQVGYLTSYTETDPIFTASPAFDITSLAIASWHQAHGWGDHSQVGYLTSFTETDPIFAASPAYGISNMDITHWDSAFSKKVNAISVTGDNNKVVTLTREDGTTLTAAFTDVRNEPDGDEYVNSLNWDATDGVITVGRTGGLTDITVDIDGRFSLLGHEHTISSITDFPTLNSFFTNDAGYLTALPDHNHHNLYVQLTTAQSVAGSKTFTDPSYWDTSGNTTRINGGEIVGNSPDFLFRPLNQNSGNDLFFGAVTKGVRDWDDITFFGYGNFKYNTHAIYHEGNLNPGNYVSKIGTPNQTIESVLISPAFKGGDASAYSSISYVGLEMSRGTSYIRPINDLSQTLYIGGGSKDWLNIAFTLSPTGSFIVNGNNIYHEGNLDVSNLVTLSTEQTITATKLLTAERAIIGNASNQYIAISENSIGAGSYLGSARNNADGSTNYRAYWSYDSYFNDATRKWKANRTTLTRKFKVEMGHHIGAFEFSEFTGDVTQEWTDADWVKSLTFNAAYFKYKGNDVFHQGNLDPSIYAQKTYNVGTYLGATYVAGGQQTPNYFGSGKLQLNMIRGTAPGLDLGTPWHDILWLSSYTGAPENSHAIILNKSSSAVKAYIAKSAFNDTTWSTKVELYHTGNLDPSSFSLDNHLHDDRYLKLTGGVITGLIELEGTNLTSYNSSNSQGITNIVGGSGFGTLMEAPLSGHFVIGLRGNDNNDSFNIVAKVGDSADYNESVFRASPTILTYKNQDIYHEGNLDLSTFSTSTHLHDDRYLKLSGGNLTGEVNSIQSFIINNNSPYIRGFTRKTDFTSSSGGWAREFIEFDNINASTERFRGVILGAGAEYTYASLGFGGYNDAETIKIYTDGKVVVKSLNVDTITANNFNGNGASLTNVNAKTLDGLDSTEYLRLNLNNILKGKVTVGLSSTFRNAGVYGLYNPNLWGHIWSMGTTFSIAEDGSSSGNLYGAAYRYSANEYGSSHQFIWCINGSPSIALGYNLWVGNKAGIGVEDPTEKLEVDGNVKANSYIGDISKTLFKESYAGDWNTKILKNGIYRYTGATNSPFGGTHATIINIAEQDGTNYGFQLAQAGTSSLKFRSKATGNNTSEWYDLYHSGNDSRFVVYEMVNTTNADTLVRDGNYSTSAAFIGSPFSGTIGGNQGMISHKKWSINGNYATQEFKSINGAFVHKIRRKDNGVWTPWYDIYNSANLNISLFATSAQGAKADTALQEIPISSTQGPGVTVTNESDGLRVEVSTTGGGTDIPWQYITPTQGTGSFGYKIKAGRFIINASVKPTSKNVNVTTIGTLPASHRPDINLTFIPNIINGTGTNAKVTLQIISSTGEVNIVNPELDKNHTLTADFPIDTDD